MNFKMREIRVQGFVKFTRQTTGDTAYSLAGVYESGRSEISGAVGQRKCNSPHSFNSLVSKVCHLVGFNLAPELSGST